MLLSRGQYVASAWGIIMLIYMSPLLWTRTSGGWDFWYMWDDRTNFVENEVLKRPLSLQTLYDMFTLVRLHVYEPLGWLLKFAVVQSVGLDAWSVRMVSVVIHFGAGFILAKVSALVLDIDYMLTQLKRPGSAGLQLRQRRKHSHLHFHACCMSTAVFMVHPLHVEVVAWPSAQPYTLSGLFSCWALLVHVKNIRQNLNKLMRGNLEESAASHKNLGLNTLIGDGTMSSSLLSSVLYFCALLSKSASLLLPAGFLLIDAWVYLQLSPGQRTISTKQISKFVARKLLSVAILLVFVSVTAFSNAEGGLPDVVSLSLGERVLKALNSPVWVLRCLVWPSKLRPHYQIQAGDVSLANSECLFSLATSMFVLVLVSSNLWHRGVSKHTLALAFFISMLMPVSGLIRHGIITAGSNRYAYLPTMVVVPYGGWAIAHWMLGRCSVPDENQHPIAPAWDAPEREILHSSCNTKQRQNILRKPLIHTTGSHTYAWIICFVLVGTLLSISTDVLHQWRNEDSLFEYSLRMDPADWKILGQRAEYLLHAGRCTPDDIECRHHWILAHEFSPRGTLKSQLYRLHLLAALGEVARACDGYISLLKDHSGNSSVHNNAAVCLAIRGVLTEARREFALALQCPAIEDTMAVHITNSRKFDTWEAERTRRGADASAAFVGAMTY